MKDSGFQLAVRLLAYDETRECPFGCGKDDWGADKHRSGCPFALAHLIAEQGGSDPADNKSAT